MKRKGTHNRPLDQRVVSETPIAISYTECVALKKYLVYWAKKISTHVIYRVVCPVNTQKLKTLSFSTRLHEIFSCVNQSGHSLIFYWDTIYYFRFIVSISDIPCVNVIIGGDYHTLLGNTYLSVVDCWNTQIKGRIQSLKRVYNKMGQSGIASVVVRAELRAK